MALRGRDRRRLDAGHLIPIEPFRSSIEYGWMPSSPRLWRAGGSGTAWRRPSAPAAFRRFKTALLDDPAERERWFACRDPRLRAAARAWLAEQGIEPTESTERAG